jgi:hypothetical protein
MSLPARARLEVEETLLDEPSSPSFQAPPVQVPCPADQILTEPIFATPVTEEKAREHVGHSVLVLRKIALQHRVEEQVPITQRAPFSRGVKQQRAALYSGPEDELRIGSAGAGPFRFRASTVTRLPAGEKRLELNDWHDYALTPKPE